MTAGAGSLRELHACLWGLIHVAPLRTSARVFVVNVVAALFAGRALVGRAESPRRSVAAGLS
ncbi:MAG: hypothetical protein M3163_12255, partial [Actinomycetota bacterium]|nr:hypothetical protein [Actinomycetota bacterium]